MPSFGRNYEMEINVEKSTAMRISMQFPIQIMTDQKQVENE
jgi:hypothetical protein